MHVSGRLLAAGVLLLAAGQIGQAQEIRFGPGGISIVPPAPPPPPPPVVIREEPARELIGRREAREIAFGQGMIEIRSVDRDDIHYQVRGEDRSGMRMRVTIDGRNGRVLEVVRREGGGGPGPGPGPAPDFDRGRGR
jgi:hypothetical protein